MGEREGKTEEEEEEGEEVEEDGKRGVTGRERVRPVMGGG